MPNLREKLQGLLNKHIEITTFSSDGSERAQLLEVGDDYIVVNPATAWDDKKIRIIPFAAIDNIEAISTE
ncbi:MAG: hypothetical protein CUN55_12615 [Phototrophicales bacterium]|nr:MAG: hypothetical protein CUN55_12615 [Phototrophicales bacterium]